MKYDLWDSLLVCRDLVLGLISLYKLYMYKDISFYEALFQKVDTLLGAKSLSKTHRGRNKADDCRESRRCLIHLYCASSLHARVQGETPLSKEQEAELMQQTLAALREMRIRYPGKSEEEAEAVLDEVRRAAETQRTVRAAGPAALFHSLPELI